MYIFTLPKIGVDLYIFVTCTCSLCTNNQVFNETINNWFELFFWKLCCTHDIFDDLLPSLKINQGVQNNPYRYQGINCVTWQPKKRLKIQGYIPRIVQTLDANVMHQPLKFAREEITSNEVYHKNNLQWKNKTLKFIWKCFFDHWPLTSYCVIV